MNFLLEDWKDGKKLMIPKDFTRCSIQYSIYYKFYNARYSNYLARFSFSLIYSYI